MSELTKFVKDFSKSYFGNKQINILEAGAESGSDTEHFCLLFPNSKIYAFEPDPRRYDNLKNLTKKYSNLYFENCALGINNQEIEFYLSSREDDNKQEVWGSSSVLKPKEHLSHHPQIKFDDKPVKVNSVNLDKWMNENDVKRFDMMWLDMQGYEYNVLEASPNALNTCDFIYSEVQLIESYEGNKVYHNLKELLDSRGFIPIVEELPWKDAGNVLFFKKDIAERAISMISEMTHQ